LRFDRGEKAESEVNLLRRRENQAAIMGIECGERLCDLVGQIDGDEESLAFMNDSVIRIVANPQ
jgi:hypothetical protein